MKLIPHHQGRQVRPPRIPITGRHVASRADPPLRREPDPRPRWEVHERCEDRAGGWHHHAAFERRRDALVFLDTTAATPGNENVTTVPPRRRGEPPGIAGGAGGRGTVPPRPRNGSSA